MTSKTGEPQSNEIINKSDNFECISTDFGLIGIHFVFKTQTQNLTEATKTKVQVTKREFWLKKINRSQARKV